MNTLAEICAAKRVHVTVQKSIYSETDLLSACSQAEKPRGFITALRNHTPALIAEIKKASPSKGIIREDFDVAVLAQAYTQGGAACLSVLTDIPYFQGSDRNLTLAKAASSLPILRKDFMLEPYQIIESRALGADCVLLIMAALSDAEAKELEKTAHELGMDVLIEVHDEAELERAKTHLNSPLIGINNRDLKTLKVDIANAERIAPHLPKSALGVCESGIRTRADILRMQQCGLNVFLVGESLMRDANVAQATALLLGGNHG